MPDSVGSCPTPGASTDACPQLLEQPFPFTRQRSDLHEALELLAARKWREIYSEVDRNRARTNAAASLLTLALQSELAGKEGERLERTLARGIAWAQWLAVGGFRSRREAKEAQIAAAVGGVPLTVCVGRFSGAFGRIVHPYGDGCHIVYPDSTGLRRANFSSNCQCCRSRQTPSHQGAIARHEALEQGRYPVALFGDDRRPLLDEDGKHLQALLVTCSRCGNEFLTLDLRQRQCDQCRQHKRKGTIGPSTVDHHDPV